MKKQSLPHRCIKDKVEKWICRRPGDGMKKRPFNFKVCYLRLHLEYESEFTEWDRISMEDWPDLERDQPEVYKRHFDPNRKYPVAC